MKKIMMLVLSLLSLASLASCGETKKEAAAATVTGSYTSPSQLTYVNNRPQYNYFLTTFAFEVLETYSDNTYVLYHSSACFSALELPEEGNAAKANDRENYLIRYYGTFTQTVDDLDEDMVYINISQPTRIVSDYDSVYYADSANWTETMSKSVYDTAFVGTGGQTEKKYYTSGEEFLAAKNIKAAKFTASVKNASIDYVRLESGATNA